MSSSDNKSLKDRLRPETTVKITYGNSDTDESTNSNNVNTASDEPRYIIAYWSIRGLGAALRMMLSASQVNHWVILYDVSETNNNSGWNKETYLTDKKFLKEEYNVFMNLPFLVDVKENRVIAQTNAIYTYLGRELNMMGSNKIEESKCEELLCEIMDLRNDMVRFAYNTNVSTSIDDAEALIKRVRQSYFDKFEIYLKEKKKKNPSKPLCHLVGDTYTAPDFHLWEKLDQYNGLCTTYDLPLLLSKDDACAFPCLYEYKTHFESLPENYSYLHSFLHKELPYNNPYARFGSDPSTLLQYKRGQDAPWHNKGVILKQYDTSKKRKHDSVTE